MLLFFILFLSLGFYVSAPPYLWDTYVRLLSSLKKYHACLFCTQWDMLKIEFVIFGGGFGFGLSENFTVTIRRQEAAHTLTAPTVVCQAC